MSGFTKALRALTNPCMRPGQEPGKLCTGLRIVPGDQVVRKEDPPKVAAQRLQVVEGADHDMFAVCDECGDCRRIGSVSQILGLAPPKALTTCEE